MPKRNQHPEQIARDKIDAQLHDAGWCIQDKKSLDLNLGLGIAFKEYPTDAGPADYGLLINGQAVGVIEAKPADHGHKITSVEEQSTGYADAKPKFNANNEPLKFVIEATGEIIRLTDRRDPKPRAREVYNFPRNADIGIADGTGKCLTTLAPMRTGKSPSVHFCSSETMASSVTSRIATNRLTFVRYATR